MSDPRSDSELLQAYADGDANDAFAALVQRHVGLVYRAALRQLGGDAHTAEDITQGVFTLLAKKAHALGAHQSVAGWLYTTTRNLVRNQQRAVMRRRHYEQEALMMNESYPGVNWERLRPVIDEALADLNSADREALVLRFFSGLSFSSIGAALGIAENAARMRVDRAPDKLGRQLDKRGIRSTGGALAVALGPEALSAATPTHLALRVIEAASATTAGTVATTGLIAFMTTTKTALVVSATLVFAGIAGIAYQATALENVQRAQAAADSAIRQSDARVRALAQERADVERAAKALEQEVNRARADAQRRAEAAAMASATQPWDPIREGARFMGRHPEVRKAMTEVSRAVSRRRYAGLLSQLNLPPDRANAVVDRLAQDLKVFIPIGPEGQAAAFGMADEVDGSKFVSDMRDLLGDEGARKWQQYDRGATARDAAGRLAAAVSFSGSPLTNEQCAAVVNAVATHSANEQSIDWDAVNREVAPVLSPAQAAAFARVRDAIENDRKQMVVVPEKSSGDTASNSLPGR